jgi:hypothetical protein
MIVCGSLDQFVIDTCAARSRDVGLVHDAGIRAEAKWGNSSRSLRGKILAYCWCRTGW